MKKIGFMAFLFSVLLLSGCGINNDDTKKVDYTKLETDLVAKGSKYYEDNMRTTYKISQFKISLAALEADQKDITEFTNAKCDKESYVLVNVTLDEEGKHEDKYTTEVHLTCDNYTSPTK